MPLSTPAKSASLARVCKSVLGILGINSFSLAQRGEAVSKKLAELFEDAELEDEGFDVLEAILVIAEWAPSKTDHPEDWTDGVYSGGNITFTNERMKDIINAVTAMLDGYTRTAAQAPDPRQAAKEMDEAAKKRKAVDDLKKRAAALLENAEKIENNEIAHDAPAEPPLEQDEGAQPDARETLNAKRNKPSDAAALESLLNDASALQTPNPLQPPSASGKAAWTAPARASASKAKTLQLDESGRPVAKSATRLSEREWAEQTRIWARNNFSEDRAGREAREKYESYVDSMLREIPVYGWSAVHDFDMDMRQDVADGVIRQWDQYQMKTIFWSRYQKLATNDKKKEPRAYDKNEACRDWNRGRCSKSESACRFKHKCSKCGGSHKASACTS